MERFKSRRMGFKLVKVEEDVDIGNEMSLDNSSWIEVNPDAMRSSPWRSHKIYVYLNLYSLKRPSNSSIIGFSRNQLSCIGCKALIRWDTKFVQSY
nr:hypothetical protein CFP56_32070 [Quercus suber]